MPRILANMIAKNEADRYLEPVLDRLAEQVDLICFTDDNSSDGTADMAESKGAIVKRISHTNPDFSYFSHDESTLRSMSWRHLEKHAEPGDWILAIDTDEMFYYPSRGYLDKMLEQNRYDVLGVTFYHMWNETQFRMDKAWRPNVSSRLFRYKEGGVFKKSRLACGSEPTFVVEAIQRRKFCSRTSLAMKHLGYMRDEDKQAKHERYMRLDKGEFHNLTHIESIIDPEPTLVEWNIE